MSLWIATKEPLMALAGKESWVRFSRYQMKEKRRGPVKGIYIQPEPGAQKETYHPFRHYPDILRAYLELGQKARLLAEGLASEADLARDCLAFCHDYGLPGTMWRFADFFPDQHRVYSHISARLVPFKAYGRPYFPDSKVPGVPRVQFPLRAFDDLDIKWRYAEPVRYIVEPAVELFEAKQDWINFRANGHKLDDVYSEDSQQTWRERLNIYAWNVDLRVNLDSPQPRIDYMFRSLLTALDVMFLLNLTAADDLRICPQCGLIFKPKMPRQKFCTPNHENVFKVTKSRRKKAEEEKRLQARRKGRNSSRTRGGL